jgi:hypothetical protein
MRKTISYNSQDTASIIAKLEAMIVSNQKTIEKLTSDMAKQKSKTEYLEKQLDNLSAQQKVMFEDIRTSQDKMDQKMDVIHEAVNSYRISFNDITHKFEAIESYQRSNDVRWAEFIKDYKNERKVQKDINDKIKVWGAVGVMAFSMLGPIISSKLIDIL